jgi:hypothetical protein
MGKDPTEIFKNSIYTRSFLEQAYIIYIFTGPKCQTDNILTRLLESKTKMFLVQISAGILYDPGYSENNSVRKFAF